MIIIANPAAGNSGNIQILNDLAMAFKMLQPQNSAEIINTEYAGHATKIAEKAGPDVILIAAGGDGTVNEVVNGMHDKAILGILPFGTANVAALEIYGKAHDSSLAVQTILDGCEQKNYKTMDLGQINTKKFIMSAGVGVDGSITGKVNLKLKSLLHRGAYIIEFLITLFYRKIPLQYALFTDSSGKDHKIWAKSLIIMNTPCYAGPWILSSRASKHDGLLDVCAFHNINIFFIFYAFFILFFFGPRSFGKIEKVTLFQCSELFIKSNGADSQIDGDWYSQGNLSIRVLPGALKYFGKR